MSLNAERIRKAFSKNAKKPDDNKATKVVACIVDHEDAEPEAMTKWYSEKDVRSD